MAPDWSEDATLSPAHVPQSFRISLRFYLYSKMLFSMKYEKLLKTFISKFRLEWENFYVSSNRERGDTNKITRKWQSDVLKNYNEWNEKYVKFSIFHPTTETLWRCFEWRLEKFFFHSKRTKDSKVCLQFDTKKKKGVCHDVTRVYIVKIVSKSVLIPLSHEDSLQQMAMLMQCTRPLELNFWTRLYDLLTSNWAGVGTCGKCKLNFRRGLRFVASIALSWDRHSRRS